MMTKIEWTEKTWNPVVGCSKVSAGCANCYAETMARRLKAMGRPEYQDVINGKWTGKLVGVPERLDEPLKRRKPTMYFVNSMSDLFHESLAWTDIEKIFMVMVEAKQHTFQVLTKRPERMQEFISECFPSLDRCSPHIWLGVTIENQQAADERIPLLLRTPAAVRFLSCEPLLGLVALDLVNADGGPVDFARLHGLHWVIAGGESGHRARPMHPDWARSLRDQATAAGVPFFFKQFGEYKEIQFDKRGRGDILFSPINGIIDRLPDPFNDNTEEFKRTVAMRRVGKKAAGRILDGRTWNQMPEVANELLHSPQR